MTILLDNALKYTDIDGSFTLDASWDEEVITVSVSDTGVGIKEEDLPYVFDRFYKSDKAHAGSGTGLGLSLTKKILVRVYLTPKKKKDACLKASFTFIISYFVPASPLNTSQAISIFSSRKSYSDV